jgi:hypothetical protein
MVSSRLGVWLGTAILLVAALSGCGSHHTGGIATSVTRITLAPAGSVSLQQGNSITFTASAQNASGSTTIAALSYFSSDNRILNVAPNGVACGGVWNNNYTICTPAGTGAVQVWAQAGGTSSDPTWVFVHPPIDSVTVTGVLLNSIPIQEPCLSQGQTMTLQAHAFSQGADITTTVGTFTWSAQFPTVVNISPTKDLFYTVPTYYATATAIQPGLTQIYATIDGVTSTVFQQPTFQNDQGTSSPVLNFFETCPIQNIDMEIGFAGSQQTVFATSKGTPQPVVATVTDVMGNTSLPNTYGGPQLTKIPLTWSATQPGAVSVPTGCVDTCTISTPSLGAGTVSASCTPPSCNIGFPLSPPVLSTTACTQFFSAIYPRISSCQQFIPVPVYANVPISGIVQGTPTTPAVLGSSLGCAAEEPQICYSSLYSVNLAKGQVGSPISIPTNLNSFLFDLAGNKAYAGSDFSAEVLNPANLGTNNPSFTPLGTVTGKILAISYDGNYAIFSDTLHTPNQVYVTSTAITSSEAVIPLDIFGASAAAFSPDGLKAFIFGYDSNNNPNLYIYSALQALQVIPLAPQSLVNSIAFSNNGAFAYVVESSNGAGTPALRVYNTCNNQISTSAPLGGAPQIIPLTASPIAFRPLEDGVHFVALESGGNLDYITASVTPIPAATLSTPASGYLCPMTVSHTLKNLNLQQGEISAFNFFPSSDGSMLYVVATDRSGILVYDLTSNIVSGIPLVNSATPIAADISVDAGTILVAGSDGLLHEVSTAVGGSDQLQLTFQNLPDYLNPFCTFTPAAGPCTFNLVAVRP